MALTDEEIVMTQMEESIRDHRFPSSRAECESVIGIEVVVAGPKGSP